MGRQKSNDSRVATGAGLVPPVQNHGQVELSHLTSALASIRINGNASEMPANPAQAILRSLVSAEQGSKKSKARRSKARRKSGKRLVKQELPVDAVKQNFIEKLQDHHLLIVVGDPGCGKSTRLPQFLYDEVVEGNGKILCAQPRRMAAKTLAARVAEEMEDDLGDRVGYRIRFESNSSKMTRIMFVTYGVLLRELESDPLLKSYAAVMLDDIHERAIDVDITMALLKATMKKRPELIVIIASATLETERFLNYLSLSRDAIVTIPGTQPFPVEIKYKEDEKDFEYVEACVDTVLKINASNRSGDILVFLTGEEDIVSCCEQLHYMDQKQELWVLPCYAALPVEELDKVFQPVPTDYKRKVVMATNIAETSITIDGIVFVVDSGLVKQKQYQWQDRITTLHPVDITKAQAKQRAGRAGRTQPGVIYRLYRKAVYKKMKKNLLPEVQRSNLESTMLTIAALGAEDLYNFDFMDPPKREEIQLSVAALQELGALDGANELTPLGKEMAKFPLEPRMSKVLLTSLRLGCSEEVVSIGAILSAYSSGKRVFRHFRHDKVGSKAQPTAPVGDHLALLETYNTGKRSNHSWGWCERNHIDFAEMREVKHIRNQLRELLSLSNLNLPPLPSSSYPENVQRCIVAGYFNNVARKAEQGKGCGAAYIRFPLRKKNDRVYIHPSSVLFRSPPQWVIYDDVKKTKATPYMCQVIAVEPGWIKDLAPAFFLKLQTAFQDLQNGE